MINHTETPSRMTWDDIKKRYPSQWVRLSDVQWNGPTSRDIESAVVTCTGDGNEIYLLYSKHQLDAALFTTLESDVLTSGVNY